MPPKVPFDKYETYILLALLIWVKKCKIVVKNAVEILSEVLRKLAFQKGISSDSSFRSVSGLSYQIRVMDMLVEHRETDSKAPEIFISCFNTYLRDRKKYEDTFWESIYIIEDKNKDFYKYVREQSKENGIDLYWTIKEIFKSAEEQGLIVSNDYLDDFPDNIVKKLNDILKYKPFKNSSKLLTIYANRDLELLNKYLHHRKSNLDMSIKKMKANDQGAIFFRYITEKYPKIASDLYISLKDFEKAVQDSHLISGSIFDDLDMEKIELIERVSKYDEIVLQCRRQTLSDIKKSIPLMKAFVNSENNSATVKINMAKTGQPADKMQRTIIGQPETANKSEFTITPEVHNVETNSHPVSFSYYNKQITGLSSWMDVYVRFMRILWTEKNRKLIDYVGKSFDSTNCIDIVRSANISKMRKPQKISADIYLETDITPDEMLNKIKNVLYISAIPTKRLVIKYVLDETESVSQKKQEEQDNSSDDSNSDKYTLVGLTDVSKFRNTIPAYIIFLEEKIAGYNNWVELYVDFVKVLWSRYKGILKEYHGRSFNGKISPDLVHGKRTSAMISPVMIGDDYYIETNRSFMDIVGKIKALLEICGLSETDIKFAISENDTSDVQTEHEDVKIPTAVNKQKEYAESDTDIEKQYYDWLLNNYSFLPASARNYITDIKSIENRAFKIGLPVFRLLSAQSHYEAKQNCEYLLECESFKRYYVMVSSLKRFQNFINQMISGDIDINVHVDERSNNNDNGIDKETERIIAVLQNKFPNGLNVGLKREDGSYKISGNKFVKAYKEMYGDDLSKKIDVDAILSRNSMTFEGKYYLISNECRTFVDKTISKLSKYMIFTYESLYNRYAEAFSDFHIYSADMLKSMLV